MNLTSRVYAFPRGRKTEGLGNRSEEVGTGPDSWRTDTMGLGGGRSAELTTKPSRQQPISSGRKAFSLETALRKTQHSVEDCLTDPAMGDW